jgi:hypothetical protein
MPARRTSTACWHDLQRGYNLHSTGSGVRMFQEGLLKGNNILITGGRTGLGEEIAEKYLQLGASFTELDRLSDADWERMRGKSKAQNDKDREGRSA